MGLPGITVLIRLSSFVIASWVLIHLMSVLGVIVAFAYPIWYLLAPKKTVCFLCRLINKGDWCIFCHRRVENMENLSPASFASVFLNSMLILFISLASAGLVFLESRALFKLGFPPTPKTAYFNIPPKGQYRLGEIFPMKIEIADIKRPVNAIQTDISFDPRKLEVVNLSTKESFASIFIQKEINNELGYVRLTGGLPDPGFFANQGIFGTVFFRGKNPGVVEINFLPSSLVLANDGRGTNLLKGLASVSYLILPDEVSEEEKEEQAVLIRPEVLGEEAGETQMKFFEEEKILGAKIEGVEDIKRELSLTDSLFNYLESLDRFTLSFWHKIASLITR